MTGCVAGRGGRARLAPKGMFFRMPASYFGSMEAVMSDATKPGATALHRMLRLDSSRATVFVRPRTPAWRLRARH